jgi:hypothetical protein
MLIISKLYCCLVPFQLRIRDGTLCLKIQNLAILVFRNIDGLKTVGKIRGLVWIHNSEFFFYTGE